MKLISVEAAFATANLEAAMTLLEAQLDEVRAMDGCNHYALFKTSGGDGLAILQRWETMTQFDAYQSSDTFAKLGAGLRQLMSAPPVTTIAQVDQA
ncbi:MAG: antibiotic biosynthesis monooxygenase [Sulfitobacter sp.]